MLTVCQGVSAVGGCEVVEAGEAFLVATVADCDVHGAAGVDCEVVHRGNSAKAQLGEQN